MKTLIFATLIAATAFAQAEEATTTEETANLVIQRPHQQAQYSYMDYRLYLNGKNIGKLSNGEKMEFRLQPGRYTLVANDRDGSELSVVVKAGQTMVVDGRVDRELQMSLANRVTNQAIASREK